MASHSRFVRVLAGLCAVPLAAACVVHAPPDVAAIKAEGMPGVVIPQQWKAGAGEVQDNWVASFHDERLAAAVMEAIGKNPDLRVGAARVEQAMLYAKLAGAKLWPSVDVLARGGTKLSGDNSGLQGGLLSVNWELDLWARVRYGRAAAAADHASVAADFEYARQSMAATVARSWFLATEATLQAGVARAAIRDSEALVQLAETRARVGAGNDEDIYVSRASVGTYRDALRELEFAREQALRALELLLGRYPSAEIDVAATLPALVEGVPAGLPSALLERRPDVIAAERRVAAAFNRVGEAKAARLPTIALTT
ncbi:MAG TPA: TolC family protein, partial [Vicinamibacterales bacterium]